MASRPKTPKSATTLSVTPAQRAKLLGRVAAYYHRAFLDNAEGLRYLTKTRGLRDVTLAKQFQIGLATGSMLEVLSADEELLAQLTALGVLTESRHEYLNGCVVFPLWAADGTVVNLYGRRLVDGDINHLMLSGGKPGLWNLPAIKRSSFLVLTQSILDALTAIDCGLPETIPYSWPDGFTADQFAFLKQSGVKRLAIAFKSDEPGRKRAAVVAEQLRAEGFEAAIVSLPQDEDLNSYLTGRHAEDARKTLKAKVADAFASLAAGSRGGALDAAVPGELYEPTEHGFKLTLHGRSYEVKGISRETTQLKVVIKAVGDPRKGFELKTLDLFSSRSRDAYARDCARLFNEPEPVIKTDLDRVLECVEAWKPDDVVIPPAPVPSPEDTARALAFLRNPNLFEEILSDLGTLGIAGEETNKLLCYLAVVSRKLDDPLSLLIQSRSAAGKSTLQHAVLSLTPDEDQVHYTRLTTQALYYQGEMQLAHKVMAIEEAEGLGSAAYSLRALQSAKKLTVATTSKDPVSGKMKTESYRVQGPVAVLLTTTFASLDEETQSRFLTLTIDESREMTETILAAQRHRDTLEGYLAELEKSAVVRKHQTAQRLLEPLVVINPYATQLTFPVRSLRARRDHKKYLMLIKAVAFLYQKQREVKAAERSGQAFSYIEVTKDDIRRANTLAVHVLGHSADELSSPARSLLKQIHAMVKQYCAASKVLPADYRFTRKHLREETGWSDWQVRTHVKELEELEYLKARAGAWGKEYIYELTWDGDDDGSRSVGIALVDPDSLTEEA